MPFAPYTINGYLVRPYGGHYGHTLENNGKTVASFEYVDASRGNAIWFNYPDAANPGDVERQFRTLEDAVATLPPA